MIPSYQAKFESLLAKRCVEAGFDLCAERSYSNAGTYHLGEQGCMTPIFSVGFNFQRGYASFTGDLGVNARGGQWSYVQPEEMDELLDRLMECAIKTRFELST